jgi:hypothetical protein
MRTSITLDDSFYEALRSRAHAAHAAHATMDDLIQSAIRLTLATPDGAAAASFCLPSMRSGLVAGIQVESVSGLVDADDDARTVAALMSP